MQMACRCIKPPTPAFQQHHHYRCEPIVGGMVVYDEGGLAWAGDVMTFGEHFEMTGPGHNTVVKMIWYSCCNNRPSVVIHTHSNSKGETDLYDDPQRPRTAPPPLCPGEE